jgi:hypothetical protein
VALPAALAVLSLCGAAVAWVSLQRSLRKSTNPVVPGAESAQTEESDRARERRAPSPMLLQLKEERIQQ